MIVTLTANPSVDSTVELSGPLERGAVQRATSTTTDPGGKGVNVSRILAAAQSPTAAILPARAEDPLVAALGERGIPHHLVSVTGRVRGNLTITEPDGTTTKINEPGQRLGLREVDELTHTVLRHAAGARWVALCGSLPPGVPEGWYSRLVHALRALPCRTAVDTSDAPLRALAADFPASAPDLIKPNAEELAQLTGFDPDAMEEAAAKGDPGLAVRAANALRARGVGAVLATLGSAGAVLVTEEGAWFATPPTITTRSTVGAGDSALAGYLLAEVAGAEPAERLRLAVAYGTAAAGLPGTTLPRPDQVEPDSVTITELPVDLTPAPTITTVAAPAADH